MRYRLGTRNRVIIVANMIPNANEIAIGTMKKVAGLAVKINGTSPIKVVTEVSIIGRKRISLL